MRVCFDTNTFIRIFSRAPAYTIIRRSLIRGQLTMLVSNEMLFEYREVIEQRSRNVSWHLFEEFIDMLEQLGHSTQVSPHFRFSAVPVDPDDNKYTDCAIAGEAEFVITYDRDFESLRGLGFKPMPITPEELAARLDPSFR